MRQIAFYDQKSASSASSSLQSWQTWKVEKFQTFKMENSKKFLISS